MRSPIKKANPRLRFRIPAAGWGGKQACSGPTALPHSVPAWGQRAQCFSAAGAQETPRRARTLVGATGALVIPPGSCLPVIIACDIGSSRAPFRPETQKVCPAAVTSMAPASAEWVEEGRASGWEGDSASRENMSSRGCLIGKQTDRQTVGERHCWSSGLVPGAGCLTGAMDGQQG